MRTQRIWLGAGLMLTGALLMGPVHAQTIVQPDGLPLGATLDGLRALAKASSPTLQAAAQDTQAASARAEGAGALDDPTISDSYQYYKDPGVFSAHSVMISQSFPLWGKRSLRRQAAFADLDAARGQEQAARDAADEKIKVAYAQYYLIGKDIAINRELAELARRMHAATTARYEQGGDNETDVIQALGAETTAKTQMIELEGEKVAARGNLNVLVGRPADAPLADPLMARPVPASEPSLSDLIARAQAANPTLLAGNAAIAAAQARKTLAAKAWYPDITVGMGPIIQTNHMPLGFAATVGLNIPVPWGREESGQDEAAAQLDASQQRYDAAELDIEGALSEATAKLDAARATATLLQRESLPQARAEFNATLADYSQGKGELSAAIAAEQQIRTVNLSLLQAQLDEQVELAAIERLIGSDL